MPGGPARPATLTRRGPQTRHTANSPGRIHAPSRCYGRAANRSPGSIAESFCCERTTGGPTSPGQVTNVSTPSGSLVSIALPGPTASSGLVWRLARGVNIKVLREVAERNIGRDVVVIYKAVGRGQATVAYGLTKGETRKACKSVTYKISVR